MNIFQEWIFFRSEYFSGVIIFLGWIFFRGEYFFRGDYFSGVNIFQGWIFFRCDYFSRVNIFQGWLSLSFHIFVGQVENNIMYFTGLWRTMEHIIEQNILGTSWTDLPKRPTQIFELMEIESKYLDISNSVFTMNSSTDKKIVFWSFLGRDFIYMWEKFQHCQSS